MEIKVKLFRVVSRKDHLKKEYHRQAAAVAHPALPVTLRYQVDWSLTSVGLAGSYRDEDTVRLPPGSVCSSTCYLYRTMDA